jgi:1,4-alpha-glucan branching enzyme
MKMNQPVNSKESGSTARKVRVKFVHQTAMQVCIGGTFNDWQPAVTPMVPLGDGRLAKELTLPSSVYEYGLVVDGVWMPDPRATETAPNPHGGVNSVLKTEEMRELTLLTAALQNTSRMHLYL